MKNQLLRQCCLFYSMPMYVTLLAIPKYYYYYYYYYNHYRCNFIDAAIYVQYGYRLTATDLQLTMYN